MVFIHLYFDPLSRKLALEEVGCCEGFCIVYVCKDCMQQCVGPYRGLSVCGVHPFVLRFYKLKVSTGGGGLGNQATPRGYVQCIMDLPYDGGDDLVCCAVPSCVISSPQTLNAEEERC